MTKHHSCKDLDNLSYPEMGEAFKSENYMQRSRAYWTNSAMYWFKEYKESNHNIKWLIDSLSDVRQLRSLALQSIR